MSSNQIDRRLVLVLGALVTLGGCLSAEGDIPGADTADTPDEAGEVDEAVSGLTLGPTRCPSLTLRRNGKNGLSGQAFTVSTTAVPGPLTARIVNNGQHITCSPTTAADLLVYTTPWERRIAGFPVRTSQQGNVLDVNPDLPFQVTPEGNMAITSFSFNPGELRLEGAGWPSRTVTSITQFDRSQDAAFDFFNVRARLYAKSPLTLMQNRPSELVSTSGDRFIYRCDLQGTARRNACSSLCSMKCTANIGFPPDSEGINRCISDCTTPCASDAGCSPIFCSGNDCAGTCAPANVCTTNAQCGAGRTCGGQGCCITIIR